MSTVLARQMMRHRCDTQRDANFGEEDEAGNTLTPNPQPHLSGQPCYFHADFRSGFSGEFSVTGGERGVTRTLYRLMVPRDADISNFDEVTEIRDARGQTLYGGGYLHIDNFEVTEFYTVFYLTERR